MAFCQTDPINKNEIPFTQLRYVASLWTGRPILELYPNVTVTFEGEDTDIDIEQMSVRQILKNEV